jgi:hypothetical protein
MESLESQVTKFSNLANAKSFANRCNKIHLVILGDDGKFWVALPKITEQLVKHGYEYAK